MEGKRAGLKVAGDDRQDLVVDPTADLIPDHPLFGRKLLVESEEVDTPKAHRSVLPAMRPKGHQAIGQ